MSLTSGLLLHLTREDEIASVRLRLRERPDVTVGEPEGRWLPVVIGAEDDAGLRELHDWVAALPGVGFVDVVHVNFDDAGDPSGMSDGSACVSGGETLTLSSIIP